ncbi:Trypsin [Thalassocella blandensis]|nr:Trypsin [Thalassocella blandensis]
MSNWIQHSVAALAVSISPFMAPLASAKTETDIESQALNAKLFNVGFVYGSVYEDLNENGKRGLFEPAIENAIVYLDENNNNVRDRNELFARTDANGVYFFSPLPTGDYVVRQEVAFGWRNISGGAGDDVTPIVVNNGANSPRDITPKIIGGAEVEPGEYPFMVAVGYNLSGDFNQFCGGVLISDSWVATAAHCSEGTNPLDVGVLVGTNDIYDGSGQLLEVEDIVLHPEFDSILSVGGGYDIALWKLAQPIDLAASGLESISMLSPENAALAADGQLATTVGWGVSDLASVLLQDVHLPVADTEACMAAYPDAINFETQICGGVPEGGVDACQGDSGGPLLVRDADTDQWKLAGLTSYGNGCAQAGFPGVWSRVSALSDWAKETAVGGSRFHDVRVRPLQFAKADFGNKQTTFSPSKPIDPRWQLVSSAVTSDETGVSFDWRILDESFVPREFDCEIDVDGPAPIPAETVACYSGFNRAVLSELEDGIYYSTLFAGFEGDGFTRNNLFVTGTPSEVSVRGSLTGDDEIDSDYPLFTYFIDYFDIAGVTGDKPVQIQVTSDSLEDLYIVIYDRDVREAQGAGGVLDVAYSFGVGSVSEFLFLPEPGVNYLLGVSTFTEALTGDYTVSVVNEGEPVPTVLGEPTALNLEVRSLRKLQELKTVVPVPRRP